MKSSFYISHINLSEDGDNFVAVLNVVIKMKLLNDFSYPLYIYPWCESLLFKLQIYENQVDWNYTTGSTSEFIKKCVFSVELLIWEYDETRIRGFPIRRLPYISYSLSVPYFFIIILARGKWQNIEVEKFFLLHLVSITAIWLKSIL